MGREGGALTGSCAILVCRASNQSSRRSHKWTTPAPWSLITSLGSSFSRLPWVGVVGPTTSSSPGLGNCRRPWPCLALALVFAGASTSASFDGLASGGRPASCPSQTYGCVSVSRASLVRLPAHLHAKGLPCVFGLTLIIALTPRLGVGLATMAMLYVSLANTTRGAAFSTR